ncbi:MAG: peptidylprolyl isomerase, partial [Gammaproteobacteria bacterium]|nr:peptidylprolyl isomerase [Gammaproteobacteria bacterium]
MLQTIRDRTQGIIATIIVGIVALTFAIWGIHYYLEESKSSTVVVQVNSAKLTQDNFERILRRNQRLFSLANPNMPMSDALQKKMQKAAVEQWVQQAVLSQAAMHERFVVSASMLRDTLSNLEMFQENGRFSTTLYQQRLDAMGYTPQEFQQTLENELLIGQVRYGLVQSAFVLPSELQDAIGTLYQTRDMGYIIVPGKSFINNVVIKPADIKQYYDTHSQDFMDPEKVKIEYIQIKPEDLKQQIPVSDADIKNYYDTHLADYSSVPQWQIRFVKLANAANANNTLQDANALRDAMMKDKSFAAAQKRGLTPNELWVTPASVPAELAPVLAKSKVGDWL